MANKQALRDLQARLAERLQAARGQVRRQSWLAVESGGLGFLLPLAESGEIFALSPIQPVPYSQRWFLGVANLRGHLHGVVDLAAFLGLTATPSSQRDQPARLVGFNPSLDLNCVLLVDRLSGLRSEDELTLASAATGERPRFAGARLKDANGRTWQELLLSELAGNDTFLAIAA